MMDCGSVQSVARKVLRPWFAYVVLAISGCGAGSDVTPENTRQTSQALAASDKYTYNSNCGGVCNAAGLYGSSADYNGDGIQDVIMANENGIFEFLGQASGGFNEGPSINPLWNSRTVNITTGDFNGDGATDFIVQTTASASEVLGIKGPNGGFTLTTWVRTDLGYDAAHFYASDFNGDGATDVIIATVQGSFEYLGLKSPSGGFNVGNWSRSDLPNGSVGYTVGDFNGDQVADAIITTSQGSFEYLGAKGTAGGFSPYCLSVPPYVCWTRLDLPIGKTGYVAGDFNGDGISDLIITVASGSYEYLGRLTRGGQGGGFIPNVWTDPDFMYQSALFAPGDFNGDGKTDLIITTSKGSYLYIGTNVGGLTQLGTPRTDLTLGTVWYAPGAYRNKQFDDVIIQTKMGSVEYLGGPGGLTPGMWSDPTLLIDTGGGGVLYY